MTNYELKAPPLFQVNFEAGGDFGEKTLMFSTDDAFMDITHGQTINIANNAELGADISLPNYDGFPAGVMDRTLSSRPTSLPGPCLDPGFENFLASLFKPSGPSVNPPGLFSVPQIKTQRAGLDKENQAPSPGPAARGQSLITLRKTDQPSPRGETLCPQSDVSMDMTETETGRIQGLQGQETPPHLDRVTAEETNRQQSSGPKGTELTIS